MLSEDMGFYFNFIDKKEQHIAQGLKQRGAVLLYENGGEKESVSVYFRMRSSGSPRAA